MPDQIALVQPQPLQNPMDTINSLLGIKQKQQALQTGQYTQQTAQAGADVAARSNQNQALVQGYMTNPKNQGKSLDEMQGDLQNYGAEGQTAFQHIVEGRRLQTNLKSEVMDLNTKKRGLVVGALTPYSDPTNVTPNASLAKQIDAIADQDSDLAGAAHWIKTSLNGMIPDPSTAKNPQQAAQMAAARAKIVQGELATYTGKSGVTPGVRDQGTTATPVVTSDVTGTQTPTGPSYDKSQVTTLGNGQLGVVGPGGARVLPSVGPQVGPQSSAPTGKLQGIPRPEANAPASDQQRFTAQMEQGRQHSTDVSAAANDVQNGVGPTRYRNDQIQDVLNSKTFSPTGPGAEQLNWIASRIPGESGDAFQKINHYLAQNSAAIATKMGVPSTNAGAAQAGAAAGNTSQNRGALLEVTKVNDAMNTALDLYNRGLAKATNNGSDPSKVAAFRQAFGQNFDMNTLRYDDALRRGDKAEIDKIAAGYGPAGSQQRQAGLQAMGQKRKILHALSDTGDLP